MAGAVAVGVVVAVVVVVGVGVAVVVGVVVAVGIGVGIAVGIVVVVAVGVAVVVGVNLTNCPRCGQSNRASVHTCTPTPFIGELETRLAERRDFALSIFATPTKGETK